MEHWRAVMQQLVATYSPEQQRFHPSKDQWSMLQVMKHLVIAEAGILNAIKKSVQKHNLQDNNLVQKMAYLLTKTILRLPVKIKAPVQALIPNEETDYDKIIAEWNVLRKEWRIFLESFPANLYNKNVFRHPVAGFFNIHQSIDFCCYHIKHHLQQIDRIDQAIKHTSAISAS
ncbi:MAG: DinB family protein [Cytophagales bacterium]|nr:DinB family protein [Bernardetiaceae bacterium]MDW8205242.1 DinB family protein [Cytophagales bacterium]